jgi:hypothetical protein
MIDFAAPPFCALAVPCRTPHPAPLYGGAVRQPERSTCSTLQRSTFASAATRPANRWRGRDARHPQRDRRAGHGAGSRYRSSR